jgi:hypothetical protein
LSRRVLPQAPIGRCTEPLTILRLFVSQSLAWDAEVGIAASGILKKDMDPSPRGAKLPSQDGVLRVPDTQQAMRLRLRLAPQ